MLAQLVEYDNRGRRSTKVLIDAMKMSISYIFFNLIYIPGTHDLISLASIMLSGQTQVYLGGCLPT